MLWPFSLNILDFSQDIVSGNPKLNLAFVANLFNNFPALELEETEEEYEPYEENREEKSKKMLRLNPHILYIFCIFLVNSICRAFAVETVTGTTQNGMAT